MQAGSEMSLRNHDGNHDPPSRVGRPSSKNLSEHNLQYFSEQNAKNLSVDNLQDLFDRP